jgi:hypothetical protein
LRAAETSRFEAQVNADARALDQLLDDGLEYTHSNGDLDTKKSFIESLTSGTRDYISSVAAIETVRIFGDVGVIRGRPRLRWAARIVSRRICTSATPTYGCGKTGAGR